MHKQIIDLSGPEGNAFYLMGLVSKLYRQAGAPELADHVLSEMKSGDYENLLQVFELYLGDRFELVR